MMVNKRNWSASGSRTCPVNPPPVKGPCTWNLQVHTPYCSRVLLQYANIQGLISNGNAVAQHLEQKDPHILILTETCVSEKHDEAEFYLNNYNFESQFRSHRGLCIYIRSNIAYSRANSYEIFTETAQTIVLKISFGQGRIFFLISIYRSPSEPASSKFFENLTTKLDAIRSKNPKSEIIVVGDFNIHHKEWLKHSSCTDEVGNQAYLFANSHDLTQIVTEPTYIPRNPSHFRNLLDLCLTSVPELMQASVEAQLGTSDHALVSTFLDISPPTTVKALPRRVWHFDKGDLEGLKKFYKGFPWKLHVLKGAEGDVNVAVGNFTQTVLFGMDKFIPNSYITPKEKPKFSKASAEAVKEKKKAYKKFKKGTMSREDYKRVSRKCKKIIDKDAKRIIKRKAEKAAECTTADRQFYQLVASVASNDTKSSLPPLETPDGRLVVDSKEKADLLAHMFATNSQLDNPNNISPPKLAEKGPKMKHILFKTRKVREYLENLEVHKANGPDEIPARILKLCALELAPIITKIYIMSYRSGICPSSWKCANVQAIPKKGDKSDPTNYRPIALISIISKVFERYINDHIIKHLEDNNLISDRQYGFRKQRSTGDLLSYVTNRWNEAMERHGETVVVALDIAKAFDKVWHANLLQKLKTIGIDETTLNWLESFLDHRVIRVVIDGFSSEPHIVNAGVPQGSVLSPTLFLIYINDLLDITDNPIHSFADDSNLHASHKYTDKRTTEQVTTARKRLFDSINSDIDKIVQWGKMNLVTFNSSKTQVSYISRLKTANNNIIKMNGSQLEEVDKLRILGVDLSSNLKWNQHINDIANKAARKLGFLNRCRKYFKSHQVLQIYKSHIRSCLEYCSNVWGGAAKTTLNRLDSIQRRAIKIINNPKLTDSLDSLEHRRKVADLTIFYRYYHNYCSAEISNNMPTALQPNRNTRQASSLHSRSVTLKTQQSTDFNNDFFNRTSRLWNQLPSSVFPNYFNKQSLQAFKVAVHIWLKANPNR